MTKAVLAVAGLGLGAGVMYLADPDQGRRRRARLCDATRHAAHLVKGVEAVTGVAEVENRLQRQQHAHHVPALQGPGARKIARVPASWTGWSPTARLIAGAAGVALLALSSPNRPVRGAATGIAGVELLERALLGTRG